MTTQSLGVRAAEDRARIAALLARYPHVSSADLCEIQTWFDRTATSLDVGLLAADAMIADQYRAWRREHYDRFRPRDLLKAGAFLAVVVGLVRGIVLLMP